MKKIQLMIMAFVCTLSLNAQSRKDAVNVIFTIDKSIPSCLYFSNENEDKEGVVRIDDPQTFLKNVLLFNNETTIVLNDTDIDIVGGKHEFFTEYYKGIEVDKTRCGIHYNCNGLITMVNGNFRTIENLDTSPQISEDEAIQSILNDIKAEKYAWEDPESERLIKIAKDNENATNYPRGELVIFFKNDIPYLAYKYHISTVSPYLRYCVYVDAKNGKVLDKKNASCTISTSVNTKYSGLQTVQTYYNSGTYKLRDYTRGNGVETYNALGNDYTSPDNNWDNLSSAEKGVLDAHWGVETTYDYYLSNFNWNSYDGSGSKIISFANISNFDNAEWDENSNTMKFGYMNNISSRPLTCLDIVSHELTHGVTLSTSNLNYENESGALNEGLSDIFAVCVENYGKPGNGNNIWQMGEDISAIRDLRSPDCKYYQGTGWINSSSNPSYYNDYGGVHTNSGVLGYWFYLLATGGNGSNESGYAVPVTNIGLDMAIQICFYLNRYLLNSTSGFSDIKNYSYSAAQALGYGSSVIDQLRNAWFDVGVESFSGLNLYIDGATVINGSSTYSVKNLPSGYTVTWSLSDSYYSQNCFQQNSTTRSCTITRSNYQEMSNATLTAVIQLNGVTVKTLTKTKLYAYSGFKGIYYNGQTSKQINLPDPLYVLPGTLVIINSPNLIRSGLTHSGVTPTVWIHSYESEVLKVGMPSNNNSLITVHVVCDSGLSYDLNIITTNNLNQLSANVSEGQIEVTISPESEEKQSDSQTEDMVWTLEVFNATSLERVFTKTVRGKSYIIDTTGWKPGVYVVKVTIGKEVYSKKIVIK